MTHGDTEWTTEGVVSGTEAGAYSFGRDPGVLGLGRMAARPMAGRQPLADRLALPQRQIPALLGAEWPRCPNPDEVWRRLQTGGLRA
jgi:hypothetical protein